MTAELLAGRYRLGRLLGRGGMGAVHEAHDEVLGRDVAVKLLDVRQAPPAAVERFRREAQFLAGLAHPNVVTVFDFGVDDSGAWLVMELLPGPTLQELLDADGPLPVADVLAYGRQCASALVAAHAAGITHRDVKPANVMLAGDGTCKLLDLGIARLNGAVTTQPALTQAGTILGTVPYLAPEVITGATPEPPADLYALGGVLFALLTARPPFPAEELMAAMAQHVHAPAPRASAARDDVPPLLDGLIVDLLAKDPAARPTAAQVVDRLDGRADPAGTPTVALAAAPVGTTQFLPRPAAAARAAPTPPARRRPALIVGGAALVLVVGAVIAAVIAASAASGGGTSGGGHPAALPQGGSTSSTPSASTASRTAPSSSPRPSSTRPTSLAAALTALRSAVQSAQADGGLAPVDAQDLLRRVDAMSTAGAPAPAPPDHGGKHGKGKPKGHDHGEPAKGGSDLPAQLDDFSRRLDDLSGKGRISRPAYTSIGAAVDVVRSFIRTGD